MKSILGITAVLALLAIVLSTTTDALADQDKQAPLADDAKPAKEAQPVKPLDIALDHYMLIPPSPNYDLNGADLPPDPTIIPFSGWQFLGKDGQPQPWRVRSPGIYGKSGGQSVQWGKAYTISVCWRYPKNSKAHQIYMRPPRKYDVFSGGGGGRSGSTHPDFDFRSQRFELEDLTRLPDQLPLSMRYLHGDWQLVAKADFPLKQPLGNDHVSIQYLGELRPNSPVFKDLQADRERDEDPFYQTPFNLEIHATKRYSQSKWEYHINWYDKQSKSRFFSGYGTSSGADHYTLMKVDTETIDRVEIRRLQILHQKIAPLNLKPIIALPAEDIIQKRLDVTADHTFGKPITLTLDAITPGANCLIDLDRAKVIALPDPAPTGDAFAQFAHEHGADLMLYYDKGHKRSKLRIQALACTTYMLKQAYWEQTPDACIKHVRADSLWVDTNWGAGWGLEKNEWRPSLAVTSEGGVALFRETKATTDDVGKTGSVTFEIRQIIPPKP